MKMEKMMPQISIIMPVYNTEEEYLREAIESILNQTFVDFELIIVDDGSTNNAKDTIFSYIDERIKYFYQENRGAGAARNKGLSESKGKYIIFMDSDDWLNLRICEKLFLKAEEKDLDILLFGMYTFDNKNKTINIFDDLAMFDSKFDDAIFNFKPPFKFNKLFQVSNTCCAKLFRRDFFKKNNLVFFEGLIFEDTEFFFRYIFKAEKISILRDNSYFYRQNISHSVTTNKNEKHLGLIEIFKLIEQSLLENNAFEQFKIQYYKYKFTTLRYIYNRIDKEFKKEFKRLILKDLQDTKLTNSEFGKLSKYPPLLYKTFLYNRFRYEVKSIIIQLLNFFNIRINNKKKLVRVSYSWFSDNKRNNFETSDIKITTDKVKKCDLFIALNAPKENINIKAKQAWVFTFEPPVIESSGIFKDNFYRYDRAYTSYPGNEDDNIINSTALSEWHIGKTYTELLTLKPVAKNDEVIWVTSNLNWLEGHQKRLQFIDYVKKNTNYKLYGRGINPIKSKYEVYKNAKYAIGVENTYAEDYWTEKLADSYLAYCMPIYYGCPNITKYFPKESMIIIDIEKPDEAEQIIQNAIDEDLYTKNFKYILEARDIVLKELWVYPFVVNEIRKMDFDNLEYKKVKIPACQSLSKTFKRKLKNRIKKIIRGSKCRKSA